MLDHEMAAQLQQYMGMLRRPLTITASLGEDAKSAELRVLPQLHRTWWRAVLGQVRPGA